MPNAVIRRFSRLEQIITVIGDQGFQVVVRDDINYRGFPRLAIKTATVGWAQAFG